MTYDTPSFNAPMSSLLGFSIALAILPVYLILLYIYKKDQNKENHRLLRSLFLFGMLSCAPALVFEILFKNLFVISTENMNFIMLFLYVFIGVALVEEVCKWFFIKIKAYNHPDFDYLYDAIVYAVFVSLGFAFLENLLYILTSSALTGIIRAITAVPAHAINGVLMGEYLGLAKQYEVMGRYQDRNRNLFLSILIPTLAHGAYDFLLYAGSAQFLVLFLALLVFLYIYSIGKVNKISRIRVNFYNKPISKEVFRNVRHQVIFNYHDEQEHMNFCPNCGAQNEGNYCSRCGTKLLYDNIIKYSQKPEINQNNDLTQ